MRCETYKDLDNFILQSEVKPLRGKISKEEYQNLWSSSTDKAKELWQELLSKNEKFFRKDGYLDIEYLSDKKVYRRIPLKRGQPAKEDKIKKDKKVTIRLDDELEEILNDYCQTNNIKPSEAIRKAILKLR